MESSLQSHFLAALSLEVFLHMIEDRKGKAWIPLSLI
jgi:hypothetical protein